ncbi:MAG TPA: DUF4232 domain-containing protein [Actinomycetota bacterium]|nr:DUF4232 domain-containing protein [Actinomycetota bacterium]
MSGADDELRDSLQRRADDVRPQRDVPPGLGRRAGRRIALNSMFVGMTAAVVIVGAVVGFRAIASNGGGSGIGGSPTPPVVQSQSPGTTSPSNAPATTAAPVSPSPAATTATSPAATTGPSPSPSATARVAACTDGQLRAVGVMDGAAGSMEGTIDLTNFSGTTCSLQDRPNLDIKAGDATRSIVFIPSPAGWQADAQPAPAGWPVVTLAPGDTASVRIRWSNWCPQGSPAPLWYVEILGSGEVPVTNGMEQPPPCNGPSQPASVEVGPFEPKRPA